MSRSTRLTLLLFALALARCGGSDPPTNECPEGQKMIAGACRVPCASDDQCAAAERCNVASEQCVPKDGPAPRKGRNTAAQVSGTGTRETAKYRLRLSATAPQPAANGATSRYRMTLSPGGTR